MEYEKDLQLERDGFGISGGRGNFQSLQGSLVGLPFLSLLS